MSGTSPAATSKVRKTLLPSLLGSLGRGHLVIDTVTWFERGWGYLSWIYRTGIASSLGLRNELGVFSSIVTEYSRTELWAVL